jgi:hypothetical protein
MTDEAACPAVLPSPAAHEAERRGAERRPCDLRPFWVVAGGGAADVPPARVRDVSLTGIGLLAPRPLKPGEGLVLRLQARDGRVSRPLPVRVMHATAGGEGAWVVGCQFVRALSPRDLRELLGDE